MEIKDENKSIKDELDILIKLQAIDSDIKRLKNTAERIPQELNQHIKHYEQKEDDLKNFKQEMDNLSKSLREKERDVSAVKESLIKHNTKLNEIKTNKEYSAILSEIDGLKNKILQIEDEELEFMEQLEDFKVKLKDKEVIVKQEKEMLESKKKENQEDILKVEKTLSEETVKREELINQIENSIYQDYMKILDLRDGVAVARISGDSTCTGCHQKLRPQVVLDVKVTASLGKCPNCTRFLYWKDQPKAD